MQKFKDWVITKLGGTTESGLEFIEGQYIAEKEEFSKVCESFYNKYLQVRPEYVAPVDTFLTDFYSKDTVLLLNSGTTFGNSEVGGLVYAPWARHCIAYNVKYTD